MEESQRKLISREEWENVLKVVDIRKEDMNELVMNFLATECYEKAAEKFIHESGTNLSGMDLEGIRARAKIKRKILSGDVNDAMDDISSDKLSAFSGDVNFQLAQQIMIEVIRDGGVEKALDFGEECFADHADKYPHILEEIERTCCLLAFEDPLNCPLGELMGASQRLMTANAVNQEILICEDHEKEPKLYNMLRELLLVQDQLNEKAAYPKLNLSLRILEDPVI